MVSSESGKNFYNWQVAQCHKYCTISFHELLGRSRWRRGALEKHEPLLGHASPPYIASEQMAKLLKAGAEIRRLKGTTFTEHRARPA